MKLILLSGMSGSGKTVALHTLEDAGYFCVDNLPLGLLSAFVESMQQNKDHLYDQVAVAIDARSGRHDIHHLDPWIEAVKSQIDSIKILFLTSNDASLLKRFSETRRRHPLSGKELSLYDAIQEERELLKEINSHADFTIDTSTLNVHELRQTIVKQLLPERGEETSILIQSFGFKHGLPANTDFVFDVRCLPNPHWEAELRPLNGRDKAIVEYLEGYEEVESMAQDLMNFVNRWVPCFIRENRSYITFSIGCTGGKHRSVYLVERITAELVANGFNASLKHRDLK